ncbi:unnamed protein product [Protopolystoma xenopodis]|uniref:Uncharacterized protein n=1 Tax=Protopolystoma xenopodis TaxID=117903 RepID=A0A3S5AFD2_9PLAT|nr:unnamed protein product [Protopolystoma xenopodis]
MVVAVEHEDMFIGPKVNHQPDFYGGSPPRQAIVCNPFVDSFFLLQSEASETNGPGWPYPASWRTSDSKDRNAAFMGTAYPAELADQTASGTVASTELLLPHLRSPDASSTAASASAQSAVSSAPPDLPADPDPDAGSVSTVPDFGTFPLKVSSDPHNPTFSPSPIRSASFRPNTLTAGGMQQFLSSSSSSASVSPSHPKLKSRAEFLQSRPKRNASQTGADMRPSKTKTPESGWKWRIAQKRLKNEPSLVRNAGESGAVRTSPDENDFSVLKRRNGAADHAIEAVSNRPRRRYPRQLRPSNIPSMTALMRQQSSVTFFTFTTPNYPQAYPPLTDCIKVIQGEFTNWLNSLVSFFGIKWF